MSKLKSLKRKQFCEYIIFQGGFCCGSVYSQADRFARALTRVCQLHAFSALGLPL